MLNLDLPGKDIVTTEHNKHGEKLRKAVVNFNTRRVNNNIIHVVIFIVKYMNLYCKIYESLS